MRIAQLKWVAPMAMAAATLLASTSVALASGGSGGGGGSVGTGGGGSTAVIPQVVGRWNGPEQFTDNLGAPLGLPRAMSFDIRTEDAGGNLTGVDIRMGVALAGKASSNGSILIQDGTYYGSKITLNETGTVACSNGSVGRLLTGKFKSGEGSGTISLDNCPAS